MRKHAILISWLRYKPTYLKTPAQPTASPEAGHLALLLVEPMQRRRVGRVASATAAAVHAA